MAQIPALLLPPRAAALPEPLFRVQSLTDGRGPFRPGLSERWARPRIGRAYPRPFGPANVSVALMKALTQPEFGRVFGCACRTLEELRVWFSAEEFESLRALGFHAVEIQAQRILLADAHQVLFQRTSSHLTTTRAGIDLY